MIILGKKRLQFSSSTTNIVFHGNSIVAGYLDDAAYHIPLLMGTFYPLAGTGIAVQGLGHTGWTWEMLDNKQSPGFSTDVDGAYVNGKTNILLAWETTNSVVSNGETGAQTLAASQTYWVDRLAANSWERTIYVCTLPRGKDAGSNAVSQGIVDSYNAEMRYVDNWYKGNYKTIGLSWVIDPQAPGGPFNWPDYNLSTFATNSAIIQSDYTHPTDYGASLLARFIASSLGNLS